MAELDGVKEISMEAHLGLEPMRGSLTGTYQDLLDYIDWSINVFAGKGNLDTNQKGKAFADGIRALKARFGTEVSTHYLKQFCDKQKHKNLHIQYMLSLADYKTEPHKTSFKGGIANGRRCIVPKIFDMLISKVEWEEQRQRCEAFGKKCLAEWEARDKALEQQKLNVAKLQIVAGMEGVEVEPSELDELAPDLKKPDREMQKMEMTMQMR